MSDFVLKYADARGEVHNQVAQGASEQDVRERYTRQGFLVYSVKAKQAGLSLSGEINIPGRRRKLNLEKFLIFNQQFVTLVRAGLPILKSLDLLAERLTDAKLTPYVNSVREDVRKGALLSEAFRAQGIFPKIYVTSIMAGEKSGSLVEVLERYITYQKLALAVRKKVLVSLMYPSVLIVLVVLLMVFLVTYVVPSFATLYNSMNARLPTITLYLIAIGTTARNYVLTGAGALFGLIFLYIWWSRKESAREKIDGVKVKVPLFGDIWIKYQVAQFSRVLGTLLTGGIPLVQGLETAADSLGTPLLRKTLDKAGKSVREGQSLSSSLAASGIFPELSVDMIEVGESTGALPAMLTSVAEFYEEDVNTKMTAALSLIEPAIMIFMGMFVAFVLIALYLPIFSLADTIR
jgi:type IV pilus assembly protein PilC